MRQSLMYVLCVVAVFMFGNSQAYAKGHSSASWVDISDDKNKYDKHCDYKVWVMEKGQWQETWYLEAFDEENAFYTINALSSVWREKDAFYALNYEDKRKFLIGEKYIDVVTFALCLPVK